jgi:quaternary ammonium compound-resistance protein SugE
MSPWLWLVTAGCAEIAWSQSIRPTDNFTRPLPTLLCLLLAIAAVYPLTRAMDELPVGTAYAVFTGMGAIGAVALGIAISGDPFDLARIGGIALIVGGVITLRVAGGA